MVRRNRLAVWLVSGAGSPSLAFVLGLATMYTKKQYLFSAQLRYLYWLLLQSFQLSYVDLSANDWNLGRG